MTWWEAAVLVAAGVAGGLTGSIAGLASLVSYPVLLVVGLPPVTANVTNTVALVFNSVGSVLGSRPELTGQGPRMRSLALVAVLGGAAGGALLLVAPAGSFELVVPWLIAGASAVILLRRRPVTDHPHRHHERLLLAGTGVIGVYGGYFGAAAGVLTLALLLATTDESLPRCNGAKNLVTGMSNAVAAVGFAVFGPVRWSAVLPLAIGFFVGGRAGPEVVRRVPSGPLRVVIALAGIGLAAALAWQAYR